MCIGITMLVIIPSLGLYQGSKHFLRQYRSQGTYSEYSPGWRKGIKERIDMYTQLKRQYQAAVEIDETNSKRICAGQGHFYTFVDIRPEKRTLQGHEKK